MSLEKIKKEVLPPLQKKVKHLHATLGSSQPAPVDQRFLDAVDKLEKMVDQVPDKNEAQQPGNDSLVEQVLEGNFTPPFSRNHSGGGYYDVVDANGTMVLDNVGKKDKAARIVKELNAKSDQDSS